MWGLDWTTWKCGIAWTCLSFAFIPSRDDRMHGLFIEIKAGQGKGQFYRLEDNIYNPKKLGPQPDLSSQHCKLGSGHGNA
ncbi:hypothetical protein BKA64DRAFT_304867 [Cadophora sp. MPI-SDFR-AT-0126]|nr:hypothetical protein BKA64DRAFT_304867 [Leotiomycetes sp. MPI-SDFR-AT-0126]